jgi:hypothetical protein
MVCKFNWEIAGNNFLRLLMFFRLLMFVHGLGLYMVKVCTSLMFVHGLGGLCL